ncbi:MAG: hypothetical protein R3Y06_06385 [Faecalibacterium sp.]
MKRNCKFFLCVLVTVVLLQGGLVQAYALEIGVDYQAYIDAAPFSLGAFASDPWQALKGLVFSSVSAQIKQLYSTYTGLLVFLLLGATVNILLVKSEWLPLLELLVAGGGFLIISPELLALAQSFSECADDWNVFLIGFIPVFAAVVASSGETVAASLYSGFFLVTVNVFAQMLSCFLNPFIECYLALSVTSAFWIGEELPEACKTVGKLLKKLVTLAGSVFVFIFGIQRVFSAAADDVVIEATKALGSTVPLVGQTITSTASTFLAGMQVIKAGLGFAAIAIIATSFLPLYLTALAHLCLLLFSGFLCKLFSLTRCGKLFDCLAIGMEALMAMVALFFFMVSVGTGLMLVIGTGG